MTSTDQLASSSTFYSTFTDRLHELSSNLSNETVFSIETLLDTFVALYTDCKAISPQSEYVSHFLDKCLLLVTLDDKTVDKIKKLRLNTQDFEVIKVLATGAVGKVCLVKGKLDKRIYAMKILKKHDLLTRREAAFFMEERNALVTAQSSCWMTELHSAFQDDENLYLVMEYAPGGSLRSLLNNREDIMSEEEARFYAAEILVALEELHKMKFIHRDVKPENCLIDETGHVKLADFGSCTKTDDKLRIQSNETVGTPDYISPEILKAHEGNSTYGIECDWWSLGIIIYELLFDEVPFYSDSLMETYGKIMNHKKHFSFPPDCEASQDAQDLIKKLICDKESRLGVNGVDDIKSHPWFQSVNWNTIRQKNPPFVPELNGPDDTRYFEDEDDESKKVTKKPSMKTKDYHGHNLPFIGYTYLKNSNPTLTWSMNQTGMTGSQALLSATIHQPRSVENEKKIEELKQVLKKAQDDLLEMDKAVQKLQETKVKMEAEMRELKTSNDQSFREKNEMELKLAHMKKSLERETAVTLELKEASENYKELEKQVSELKTLIDSERSKAKEAESKFSDLSSKKEILEIEVLKFEKELQKEKEAQFNSTKQVQDLSERLRDSGNKADDLKKDKEIALAQKQKLEAELKVLKGILEENKTNLSKANDANSALEREKALLSVDIDRISKKLESLQAEKSVADQSGEISSDDRSAQIQALKTELQDLNVSKDKISEELALLTKEKALWQLELTNLKKSLDSEISANQASKSQIEDLSNKLHEATEQLHVFEKNSQASSLQIESLKQELDQAFKNLEKQAERSNESESKFDEAFKKSLVLSRELQDLKSRMSKLNHDAVFNEGKIQELQGQLSIEKKTRIQLEVAQEKFQIANEDLYKEVDRLEERIKTLSSDHSQALVTFEQDLLQLKKTNEQTEKSYQDALGELIILRQDQQDKKILVRQLEQKLDHLTILLNQNQQELDDVKGKRISAITNQSWESKTSDVDLVEELKRRDSKSIISTPVSMEKKASGFKLKTLFGSKTPKTQRPDQERALKKLEEVTEENIKQRRLSSASSSSIHAESIKSSVTKLSDLQLSETYFANGLAGWVKVPKFGKVRKGWKEQFAVVRDYKLYLFNKDKDLDAQEGIALVDLKVDVFYTRGVNQTELIHANSREIDCIFKIQFGSKSVGAIEDKPDSQANVARDIKENIVRIKEQITITQNSSIALEKMLSVASDAHKGALMLQLDSINQEVSKLRAESTRLETDLLSIDVNVANSVDAEDETARFEQDVAYHIQRIEKEIESHFKFREELIKTSIEKRNSIRGKSGAAQTNMENELATAEVEKNLIKLKEELVALRSGDKAKIAVLLEKMNEGVKVKMIHGHSFKLRKSLFSPKDCLHCHEAVWNKNVYECTGCKNACHKTCVQSIDLSCKTAASIKMADTVYVMAKDILDKTRWMAGLDFFRREFQKYHSGLVQSATASSLPPMAPTLQPNRVKTASASTKQSGPFSA